MVRWNRRKLLSAIGAASCGVCLQNACGALPFSRSVSRFSGLSLSAYSLKPHMQWWKGKRGDGTLGMLEFLEYCGREDFDAAELTAYFFAEPLQLRQLNRIKRRASLLGLDISGGAIGNDFGHPPDSDVGKRELGYAKSWIERYADLGAPAIRVFAGRSRPEGASDAEVLDNVVANLNAILPFAEKHGVMLGLENHDFTTNIDYLLAVLERVDSEWLGVTWDSANLAKTTDPYADLARIAPYAITAQIKVKTRVNDIEVQADYARLLKILQAAKYRGYLVLEYEEPEDPFVHIPKFAASVRQLLGANSTRMKTEKDTQ